MRAFYDLVGGRDIMYEFSLSYLLDPLLSLKAETESLKFLKGPGVD